MLLPSEASKIRRESRTEPHKPRRTSRAPALAKKGGKRRAAAEPWTEPSFSLSTQPEALRAEVRQRVELTAGRVEEGSCSATPASLLGLVADPGSSASTRVALKTAAILPVSWNGIPTHSRSSRARRKAGAGRFPLPASGSALGRGGGGPGETSYLTPAAHLVQIPFSHPATGMV